MCPFCLATAAIIAGSATGTGGLTALVASKFRKRASAREFPGSIETKEDRHGYKPDGSPSSESCPARKVD
jgi:hypothetical protein